MSKKKKRNPSKAPTRKPSPPVQTKSATPEASSQKSEKKSKVYKRSIFLFWFTLVALLVIFGGRWVWAITVDYYNSFVLRTGSIEEAVTNMDGLSLTEDEAEALLPLQQEWDLFTSSRLRDECTITASDGTELHAYYYNEASNVTLVVIPRFDADGTSDFLPGTWLNEETGCNILLLDQRLHGESGGTAFGYGYLEQQDLADWLNWCTENTETESYILWGEGTGANTILFAAASDLLPNSVAFAVAESPYSSLHELASRSIWKWYTVPSFPFLASIEAKVNRSNTGYQMADLELEDTLNAADCSLPVLFLEASQDEYILPEWTQAAYDAYSGSKDLLSAGTAHGTVYAFGKDEIQNKLSEEYLPLIK